MSYEIKGTIKQINDTQIFDSGFAKREFVITTDEKYPQDVKLEVLKDKCDELNEFQPNETVVAKFNLRGNEYQGKHYVSLQAWKIDKAEGAPQQAAQHATDDEIPF